MSEQIYFGTARKNINPQMPISLAGYFNARMWDKVLDDIEVRVLVLKQSCVYSAVVQFDLVTASQELVEVLHREIADIKELSPENMIVTATHSHTAPETRSGKPGSNAAYVPFAARQAAEALREAFKNMLPGEILEGKTEDKRFCFNRRYWMKNGSVVTNPGKLNPDIDRPEGEADYEIPLLGIKQNGKLKVLLANIVNHTDTIGGNSVSADWAGAFIRNIQAKLGAGSMVIPLIGCAGNINHFDVSTDMNQTCPEEPERIGKGYADSVAKALSALKPMKNPKLSTKHSEVLCAPREIDEDELNEAKLTVEKFKDVPNVGPDTDLTSEDLAKKKPIVLKYFAQTLLDMVKFTEPLKFNLVGIFLGNSCILSLPGEPFVEIGLELKNNIFKKYNAMVVSHSNGTGHLKIGGGYIPNSFNYGRGGYETTPRSNPFSVKTADLLIDAWKKLAE